LPSSKRPRLRFFIFVQTIQNFPRCMMILESIPGIGSVVAFHLLARIGDPKLLSNNRQIAALLGLVPVEDSTGDRIHRGSITRLGDPAARNKLIESAWTAIRIDPDLKKFYDRIRS